MSDAGLNSEEASEVRCARCNDVLAEGQDREVTEGGLFCRPCFDGLKATLLEEIDSQSKDVNYPLAIIGALLGGAIGVLAWWGFTVVTSISFGLVAVVIGVMVGMGTKMFSGNKRSTGLQVVSILVSIASFFYASYLVNRTFILRAFAERGEEVSLPFVPTPEIFYTVVSIGFGFMDLLFLAIVVYEAWKILAPIKIQLEATTPPKMDDSESD